MSKKYFRGREVEGWIIISDKEEAFKEKVNLLMEEYDFEDFQYSTNFDGYSLIHSATILLKKRKNRVVRLMK